MVIFLLLLVREAFATVTLKNSTRQSNEYFWYPSPKSSLSYCLPHRGKVPEYSLADTIPQYAIPYGTIPHGTIPYATTPFATTSLSDAPTAQHPILQLTQNGRCCCSRSTSYCGWPINCLLTRGLHNERRQAG